MSQQDFFSRYSFNVRTDKIGGGGFGTVYKAYDNLLHRDVAIKVSEVKTAANGKTFSLKDEFEVLSRIPKHQNIANYEELYTCETIAGVFDYAVMQYYPDGNLSKAIQDGLTAEQKEDVASQLLDGLGFLHSHQVVHRDFKPGNILVVRHGGKVVPLITDFGLSKAANTGDRSMFSNSFGGGTQRYSSPEQLQGKPLRMNTDLWSFGAILFELFTGKQLFEASSGAADTAAAELEIYNKIIGGEMQALSGLPEKWRKVAERCLVVDPERRAKSVEELRTLLGLSSRDVTADVHTTVEVPSEPEVVVREERKAEQASAPEPLSLSPKTNPRKLLPWIIGGAAALAVVALLVFFLKKGSGGVKTEEFKVNGVTFTMVEVKGGTFTMGRTEEQGDDGSEDEEPAHLVTLDDYWIGETEVTQALWQAVMDTNPSEFKGDDLPVENVSWDECQKFIQKLNGMTGKTFRLPTEAEWEYAARGGNKSQQFQYSGGNNIDREKVVWCVSNCGDRHLTRDELWEAEEVSMSKGFEPEFEMEGMDWGELLESNNCKPHPVKTKKPNELGIYDMSGNVEEICSDMLGDYSSDAQTNPKGPSEGMFRVCRGGSWSDYFSGCRVSQRSGCFGFDSTGRNDLGIRLVLAP